MSTPAEDLAAALVPVLEGWNVYGSLTASIRAPALVIVPDDPWMQPGRALGQLTEQWMAVGVVPAGDPVSGTRELHAVILATIEALPDDWALRDVGRPVTDESTGVPFLAAAARLSYAVG